MIRYDRRGFGRSDAPGKGFDYDTLSDDLAAVIDELDLHDVSLVGFSMGGGEVARYVSRHGQDRLHSVVFAAAVPPYMAQQDDNPDGPLTPELAEQFAVRAGAGPRRTARAQREPRGGVQPGAGAVPGEVRSRPSRTGGRAAALSVGARPA
ncbi:hypothetical protein GCM10023175_66590 [Pseudonocardia xishanensis]|uniref:AB hydrolase-1 domain-containing protein n=1 Tax=Pseudonocardia xishanensis TaxID=630995 RepID=A0ABP8S2C4_9PSEU